MSEPYLLARWVNCVKMNSQEGRTHKGDVYFKERKKIGEVTAEDKQEMGSKTTLVITPH